MLQTDHPDPLAQMETPAVMANLDNPETMVNPVKDLPLNNNPTGASTATLDPLAHPETTETLEIQEDLANLEIPDKVVEQAHLDLPVLLDPTETPANLETLAHLVNPDKPTKSPAQMDLPDPLELPDNPETMDNLETQEIPEAPVNPDPKETLVDPVVLERPENPEEPEPMEILVDMVVATTALPHVPLQDIKPFIQLSHTITINTLVKICILLIQTFEFDSNFF